MARKNTPAIVFIDEVDALCSARGVHEDKVARRIKTQLMIKMRGLEDEVDSRGLILGVTSRPYKLDPEVIRQFDKRIYIPLPDTPARRRMFKIHLRTTPNMLSAKDFEQLCKQTEGFSGSDISVLVKDALLQPLCSARQATHFRQIPGKDGPNYMPCEPRARGAKEMNLQYFEENGLVDKMVPLPISMKDFETVLAGAKPTVGKGELEVFEKLTAELLKKSLNDGAIDSYASTPEHSSQRPDSSASTPEHSSRRLRQSSAEMYGKSVQEEEKIRMQNDLSSTIVIERPDVKWDDVAGLENAKEVLEEAVIMPIMFPQFFTCNRKPYSGILLYGSPGTGKSYLANALASKADSTFFSVTASDFVSKWVGESEKLVSTLFAMAKKKTPAIVFIDNVDCICSARGDHESEAARRIKSQILIEMQAAKDAKDSQVVVIGATNLPYMLDKALIRRFDRRLYIPLPKAPARGAMFKIHVGNTPNVLKEEDYEQLGEMAEGFSGSDISVVVKDVLMQPLCILRQATHFRQIPGKDGPNYMPCERTAPGAMEMNLQYFEKQNLGHRVVPPPISMKDFEIVLARAKPTVGKGDLEMFERFTAEFGEEG